VVVVDRRGNFYYSSLGLTADGHGAVVVNVSTDGGRTFGAGVIAAVDDGSDKSWIAVGPDPNNPGRDNVYVTWTSYSSTGSAVAFAVSTDGGQTFQSKIIFAPGPDPDPTHPQNFTQFTNPVVDRSNGRLYIPFAHFSNSNTDFLQMLVSDDAGKRSDSPTSTFLEHSIPPSCRWCSRVRLKTAATVASASPSSRATTSAADSSACPDLSSPRG